MRTAQKSQVKDLLAFSEGGSAITEQKKTGETNNDGVKTGSQIQIAIFEEQSDC